MNDVSDSDLDRGCRSSHGPMRWFTRVLTALLVVFAPPLTAAQAMEITVAGDTVTMSGPVLGSECDDLRGILRTQQIKTVVFTRSKGGNAATGYCVGELIRESGIATAITGTCNSSCSRMWLGGVKRSLVGDNARVGLHGNYARNGSLDAGAPERLQSWVPRYAPNVDRSLLEQWTNLPRNTSMMFFYNKRAELCIDKVCTPIPNRNIKNAGLSAP